MVARRPTSKKTISLIFASFLTIIGITLTPSVKIFAEDSYSNIYGINKNQTKQSNLHNAVDSYDSQPEEGFETGNSSSKKQALGDITAVSATQDSQKQKTADESVGDGNNNAKPEENHSPDFYIFIPKINLYHRVLPNIDPRSKEEYMPVIDKYVAHGLFTKLPSDKKGRVYLFAHSKKAPLNVTPEGGYFSHIDQLENGDIIQLEYNHQTFVYEVYKTMVINPDQTEVYTGVSDKAEVALQTCWPAGSTAKRLIVLAELKSVTGS